MLAILPRIGTHYVLWIMLMAMITSCLAQTAQPWPEGDWQFHSDRRWLGSDAAFSIDLGGGRILWMFDDTFVARKAGDTRHEASFVHNTVAIQEGYDPAHASFKFFWKTAHSRPTELFQNEKNVWLWPASGIRYQNALLLFTSRIAPDSSPNSLGFKVIGWNIYRVTNPMDAPSAWHVSRIAAVNDTVILASQAIMEGEFIYLYGHSEPQHGLYVARIKGQHLAAGKLASLQWWSGDHWEWSAKHRQPIIPEAGTEASVQLDPRGGGYIEINSQGFGATDIVMRESPTLTGPWSSAKIIYRPPESDQPDAFVYAAKSHGELHGADLVLTYASNGPSEKVATDMRLYYPRFVKLFLPPHATSAKR